MATVVADEGAEAPWPQSARQAPAEAVTADGSASTERSWCLVVEHHARGARVARQRLAAELTGVIPRQMLADVVVVAAELVGNAVRHARPLPGDVLRVSWRVQPGPAGAVIEVRVTDGGGSTSHPRIRVVDADASDGRGLTIVEALTDRWGVDRDGLGQSVWATLSATPDRIGAA